MVKFTRSIKLSIAKKTFCDCISVKIFSTDLLSVDLHLLPAKKNLTSPFVKHNFVCVQPKLIFVLLYRNIHCVKSA